MKNTSCVLCAFENPKSTATAIVIRDQKLLVAKRNQEPLMGEWDFIGGYVQKDESIEQALKREIKEELGVDSRLTYIGQFTGTDSYKEFDYPVLSFAFLTELVGSGEEIAKMDDIKLALGENSALQWVSIKELNKIAFDSNMKILDFVKRKFTFDLERVRALVSQLDPSAAINEQSLYKAALDGHISQEFDETGRLVGMGWIFVRQTMLRSQAVVEDMIVDESQRGKGLGEKILRDLLKWAHQEGVEMVELTTNPKRTAANALYQKVGFKLHVTNHYLLNMGEYKY